MSVKSNLENTIAEFDKKLTAYFKIKVEQAESRQKLVSDILKKHPGTDLGIGKIENYLGLSNPSKVTLSSAISMASHFDTPIEEVLGLTPPGANYTWRGIRGNMAEHFKTIGARMKDLRTKNKLTTKDILGKVIPGQYSNSSSVNNQESAKSKPTLGVIYSYSVFFNVPMSYILCLVDRVGESQEALEIFLPSAKFGQRIRAVRAIQDLSIEDMGKYLPDFVGEAEIAGVRGMTADQMVWFADFFDISLDYIFERTEDTRGSTKFRGIPKPRRLSSQLATFLESSDFYSLSPELQKHMTKKLSETLRKEPT
jgi:transcriptional regulator with XRE-family HTH domain